MQAALEVPKIFANIDDALGWVPQPLLVSGATGCLTPGSDGKEDPLCSELNHQLFDPANLCGGLTLGG